MTEPSILLDEPSLTDAVCVTGADGKVIVRIRPDGSVELGEGVQADDAAKAFWEAIYRTAPDVARAVLKARE